MYTFAARSRNDLDDNEKKSIKKEKQFSELKTSPLNNDSLSYCMKLKGLPLLFESLLLNVD